MTWRITRATASRVLRQLRRDRRTLALVLFVPPLLLTIFCYVFNGQAFTFDRVGAPMVGIFPLISMFLVTSIAMLRERTTGTLERLMSMPLGKLDLLAGYGIAFAILATVQAAIALGVALWALELHVAGSLWAVYGFAVANAILGMALGLLLSAFASTEFQAVQFMPAAILPQILLCGLLVPRERMAALLDWISWALPMTYAYDGLARASSGLAGARIGIDAGVVVAAALAALALGALTLRRRTP